MVWLIEAGSGRLIGPKFWDRSVEILGACFGQSTDCLGNLCDNLCIKLCFGVYEAGNDHGFWFHKVEPMLGEWATHGQPTSHFGTVFNSPGLVGWTKILSVCVLRKILLELDG